MVAIHLIHVLNGGYKPLGGATLYRLRIWYPAIDKSYVPRISMVLYGSVPLFCPEIPMK